MKRTGSLIMAMVVAVVVLVSGVALAQVTALPVVTQPPTQSLTRDSTLGTSTVPVKLTWYATDYDGAIAKYELQQSTNGAAYANVSLSSATTTSVNRSLKPGNIYSFQVRAQDQTGNWSDWRQGPTFKVDVYQESSSAVEYSGLWNLENSSSAFGGGLKYASTTGASAKATFAGVRDIGWVSSKGTDRGKADVWVDGAKASTTDLYSSTAKPRKVVFVQNGLSLSQPHTLEARVTGAQNASSSGSRVDLDAYVVLSSPEEPPPSVNPVLVGAGDVAGCSRTGDEATAALLEGIPGTVFTTGDNAYENGTTSEFNNCYGPSWGRYKTRTRPALGNREYGTSGASGYFGYFGAAAGDPSRGYYSYNLGEWHIISLNSICEKVGGCDANSPMVSWLTQDLIANSNTCTLAYWHHPRFSSGPHGNDPKMGATWDVLYAANVDVVVNGHDHDYERFSPEDPSGAADSTRGIREFVVGTGGRSNDKFSTIQPNSELRSSGTYGVLKLTLNPGGYDWEFVPVANKTFWEYGSGSCH